MFGSGIKLQQRLRLRADRHLIAREGQAGGGIVDRRPAGRDALSRPERSPRVSASVGNQAGMILLVLVARPLVAGEKSWARAATGGES